ncbi:hypothetical protein D3C85_1408060 [compost metagenome]
MPKVTFRIAIEIQAPVRDQHHIAHRLRLHGLLDPAIEPRTLRIVFQPFNRNAARRTGQHHADTVLLRTVVEYRNQRRGMTIAPDQRL